MWEGNERKEDRLEGEGGGEGRENEKKTALPDTHDRFRHRHERSVLANQCILGQMGVHDAVA